MVKEKTRGKTGKRRTAFILEFQGANNIALVGDFNNWNEKTHPMKKENNEIWKKTVFLNPGRYEYRFLVDGKWQNDPKNNQLCQNRFGTYNNFLIVL
ncbi:MAG: glycogen-binding domain-containing protein [Proteobacteria bacterium]|nr:glycogen-binding domain-containing protein [Pseudomonadota bacterium]